MSYEENYSFTDEKHGEFDLPRAAFRRTPLRSVDETSSLIDSPTLIEGLPQLPFPQTNSEEDPLQHRTMVPFVASSDSFSGIVEPVKRRQSSKRRIVPFLILVIILTLIVDSVLLAIHFTQGQRGNLSLNSPNQSSAPGDSSPGGGQAVGGKVVAPGHGTAQATPSAEPSATASALPTPTGISLSPMEVNFSATVGQGNPPAQTVVIVNTGGSPVSWQAAFPLGTSWLTISPTSGTLDVGQTGQMNIYVGTSGLPPNTYNTQISMMTTDTAGNPIQGVSPQTLTISFKVLSSCLLQEIPTSLAFTVSIAQSNAPGQLIRINDVGHCAHPVTWTAVVDSNAQNWLTLSRSSGSDTGNSSRLTVYVDALQLAPGQYTGQIIFTAIDGLGNPVQGSPQIVQVTLNVSI